MQSRSFAQLMAESGCRKGSAGGCLAAAYQKFARFVSAGNSATLLSALCTLEHRAVARVSSIASIQGRKRIQVMDSLCYAVHVYR